MEARVLIKCPYCKFDNTITLSRVCVFSNKELMNCDIETGGCDKTFVIDYVGHVSYQTFKIDGQ